MARLAFVDRDGQDVDLSPHAGNKIQLAKTRCRVGSPVAQPGPDLLQTALVPASPAHSETALGVCLVFAPGQMWGFGLRYLSGTGVVIASAL